MARHCDHSLCTITWVGVTFAHVQPRKTCILSRGNVRVNSNCDHPPTGRTPGNLTFQKKYGQISDGAGETHCQIPNGAGKNIVKCPYLPRTFPI